MNHLKTIIIDDSKAIREELKILLTAFPQIVFAGEASNIQQAIKTSLLMVKQLQNIAKELNAEGNYMPQQARNVIAFYGMNNYMPLKGKAGRGYEKKNDVVDIFGERLGSDPNALERPMEGRKSIANNGVIQTMIDAVTASSRAGRKNYTKAVKNGIIQGLIKGEVSQKYSYKDRLKGLIPENDKGKVIGVKGRNKLVHYNEDGSVEILKIDDEKILNVRNRINEIETKNVLKCGECLVKIIDTIFLDCKCACTCYECADKLTQCPRCKLIIRDKIKFTLC